MTTGAPQAAFPVAAWLWRSGALIVFWLILTSFDAGALLPGIIAALVAGRVSMGLLPVNALAFSPLASVALFARFIWQSLLAGTWVARLALDPRMPIRPGIVRYRPRFAEGPVRDAFCTWSSLLPGTLPSGPDGSGGILVHCLDARAPVSAGLAREEQRFAGALGAGA